MRLFFEWMRLFFFNDSISSSVTNLSASICTQTVNPAQAYFDSAIQESTNLNQSFAQFDDHCFLKLHQTVSGQSSHLPWLDSSDLFFDFLLQRFKLVIAFLDLLFEGLTLLLLLRKFLLLGFELGLQCVSFVF